MLFRRTLLRAATLALTVGLAHPGAAQASDWLPAPPEQARVKISATPRCVQPGGLMHVTVEPTAPASIGSFFDIFTELGFRPSFFDVFTELSLRSSFFDIYYGDDLRFRPAFFDVFVELADTGERMPMTPLCVLVTPRSIEMLMQVAHGGGGGAGKGGGGGGGCVIVLLSRNGKIRAVAGGLVDPSPASMQQVLSSGQGISSFFDVFTELAIGGTSSGPTKMTRRRVLLQQGRLILQQAGEAVLDVVRPPASHDHPAPPPVRVLRCLLDGLDEQLMMALMPGR